LHRPGDFARLLDAGGGESDEQREQGGPPGNPGRGQEGDCGEQIDNRRQMPGNPADSPEDGVIGDVVAARQTVRAGAAGNARQHHRGHRDQAGDVDQEIGEQNLLQEAGRCGTGGVGHGIAILASWKDFPNPDLAERVGGEERDSTFQTGPLSFCP